MTRQFRPLRPAGQRGFSLIELMISIVIGMVVVGAVFAAYLAVGTGSRNSRAMAQMTEDVSLAMNILRSHIAMTDYAAPTGVGPGGLFTTRLSARHVLAGCSSAFANPGSGLDALTCSGVGEDSIAVMYEADQDNSIMSGGSPLDCLGNAIPAEADGSFISYSRFYVSNGQLMCLGPGAVAAQALVENIEGMKIWYGLISGTAKHQVAYYARASNTNPPNLTPYDDAVSVRVCLVVKSENEVMDNVTSYIDCDGNSTTPGDRRMYRAFTSTIVLQNRMGMN